MLNVTKFPSPNIEPKDVTINLKFKLSKEQEILQKKCLEPHKEIYINAVCGSGKTEITYLVIKEYLKRGLRVGIAIPRRAIVIELFYRLKEVFQGVKIKVVYGGHNHDINGDIVIFTTHQSYLFYHSFGLLIIDEFDAFPLKGDETLLNITKQTSIEKSIYLSATFLNSDLQNKYKLELNKRYHNHKMDKPKIIVSNIINLYYKLTSQVQDYYLKKKKVLVYFATIEALKNYAKYLSLMGVECLSIYAGNSDDIIKLKTLDSFVVLTSIILERGITISDVNVIVFDASHSVFSYATLIQICGRVGRNYLHPHGEITMYARNDDKKFSEVLKRIDYCNSYL